jgi:hypothetical protein
MEKFTVECQYAHRNPDIVYFRNILTKEECDHLIEKFSPHMKRSVTFTGESDPRRTSWSAYTNQHPGDPVVKKIIERCAILSGYPVSHVEPPQIVRYLPGERYVDHCDNYHNDQKSFKLSGQRDYTFFIYLNEPACRDQTGGETLFPKIDGDGIGVKPERGTAVFWRNINIPDRTDCKRDDILHQGRAPVGWTKYGMNVWMRTKPWIG